MGSRSRRHSIVGELDDLSHVTDPPPTAALWSYRESKMADPPFLTVGFYDNPMQVGYRWKDLDLSFPKQQTPGFHDLPVGHKPRSKLAGQRSNFDQIRGHSDHITPN